MHGNCEKILIMIGFICGPSLLFVNVGFATSLVLFSYFNEEQ